MQRTLHNLVLARRVYQSIVIRDQAGEIIAAIKVVEADRGTARLRIGAPEHIRVNRAEIDKSKYPPMTITEILEREG